MDHGGSGDVNSQGTAPNDPQGHSRGQSGFAVDSAMLGREVSQRGDKSASGRVGRARDGNGWEADEEIVR